MSTPGCLMNGACSQGSADTPIRRLAPAPDGFFRAAPARLAPATPGVVHAGIRNTCHVVGVHPRRRPARDARAGRCGRPARPRPAAIRLRADQRIQSFPEWGGGIHSTFPRSAQSNSVTPVKFPPLGTGRSAIRTPKRHACHVTRVSFLLPPRRKTTRVSHDARVIICISLSAVRKIEA